MATNDRLIKQAELENVLNLRTVLDAHKRLVKEAEDELARAEALVVHAIDQGRRQEPGPLAAGITESERRVPKWKEEFASIAGPEAVDRVIARTEPSVTRKLTIMQGGKVTKAA